MVVVLGHRSQLDGRPVVLALPLRARAAGTAFPCLVGGLLEGHVDSADPVYGRNANRYEYVNADPVNKYDLDGKICWSCGWKKTKSFVRKTWNENRQTIITWGVTIAVTGVCTIATGGAGAAGCAWFGGAVGGFVGYRYGVQQRTRSGYVRATIVGAVTGRVGSSAVSGDWRHGSRYASNVKRFFRGSGRHRR
ncbi:hypothetical protein ACFW2Y_35775 [Streptomyces sp. NPDC058877]|uniref:hypothetical protein n=2 Tax=unclassified Streptomyces TaxID=2593676 RepID=UPI0036A5CBE0